MGHDPFHGKVNLGAARQESYPCPWSLAETGDEAA
jgi:hypothetical protein